MAPPGPPGHGATALMLTLTAEDGPSASRNVIKKYGLVTMLRLINIVLVSMFVLNMVESNTLLLNLSNYFVTDTST